MQKKLFSLDQFFNTKIAIVFSLICTLAFPIACSSPESPGETNDTYYLSGTVTDEDTGLPIVKADVRVMNPAFFKQTTTDKEGQYSITYVGAGIYVHGGGGPTTNYGRSPQPVTLEVLSPGYEKGSADFPRTPGTYTINFQLKPSSN